MAAHQGKSTHWSLDIVRGVQAGLGSSTRAAVGYTHHVAITGPKAFLAVLMQIRTKTEALICQIRNATHLNPYANEGPCVLPMSPVLFERSESHGLGSLSKRVGWRCLIRPIGFVWP